MAFITSAKLVLPLTADLSDSVTGEVMSSSGDLESPIFDSGGNGLTLQRAGYYYLDNFPLGVTGRFTLSFRFTPNNPGMARHPVTGVLAEPRTALLDFGTGTVVNGEVSISSASFVLKEISQSDGKNRFYIKLSSFYTAESESYDVDEEHHVWIAYNGGGSLFRVYLDGRLLTLTPTGFIPPNIFANTTIFSVNRLTDGAAYNELRSSARIRDLFVLNAANSSQTAVQKGINDGSNYILDATDSTYEEVDLSVAFDDPTSIRVTSSTQEGSYLLISRSDGRLMRGSPLIWNVRRDFGDSAELDALSVSGGSPTVVDGSLNLATGVISL